MSAVQQEEPSGIVCGLVTQSPFPLPYTEGTPLVDSSTAEEIRSRVPGIGLDNADALREFNEIVKDEKRCESTILPIRDGVTWVNLIE